MTAFEGVKFVYAASETCEHSCVSHEEADKKPVYKIQRRLRGFGRDWNALFVVLFFEPRNQKLDAGIVGKDLAGGGELTAEHAA